MFQYAAGRALALQHNVPLLLDNASYEPKQAGMYGLNGLHIEAGMATAEQLRRFQPGTLQKVFDRLKAPHQRNPYKEPHFHFDPGFLKATPPVYLKGYWQSWKYFANIEKAIRQDFCFNIPFSDAIVDKARSLRSTDSVAMHFRRGDYTSSEAVNYHGICEPAYYQQAAEWMLQQVPGACFYIFTNDPAWVRDNLPAGIAFKILSGDVSHTQYEDLFLMSQCRHQIIANSSFSWWAAWLNEYRDKKIVAPKKWFAADTPDARDLVPDNWHRI